MKGSVTFTERLKRVNEVKKLSEKGLSNAKIAEQLGMSLNAVKRAHHYLKEIPLSNLSVEEVVAKRKELDKELSEAADEAKKLFYLYKTGVPSRDSKGKFILDDKGQKILIPKPALARDFHIRWTDSLSQRAKLYGLDNVKIESFTQINTQTNNFVPESDLDKKSLDKIADIIVGNN